jgi:hypothetical protein
MPMCDAAQVFQLARVKAGKTVGLSAKVTYQCVFVLSRASAPEIFCCSQEGDGNDLDIALVKRYGSVTDEEEVISNRTQPCNCSLERNYVPRTNYFT